MSEPISEQYPYFFQQLKTEQLQAENARLKAENGRLRAIDSLNTISLSESADWQLIGHYSDAKERIAALEAEVERLTKAGDYLSEHLKHEFGDNPSSKLWHEAKSKEVQS